MPRPPAGTLARNIEITRGLCEADEILDPWREQLKRAGIYFDLRDAIFMKLDKLKHNNREYDE